MSALATQRMKKERRVTHALRPLAAGEKVFRGGMAMVLTSGGSAGYYARTSSSKTGVVVGEFDEDVDNTTGGDGDLFVNVEFDRELHLRGYDNDTGTAVTNAMRGKPCYALDDHTVTGASNSCPRGAVYEVSEDGKTVWVEVPEGQIGATGATGSTGPTGPTGPTG